MRRVLLIGAVAVVLGMVFGGGVVLGMVIDRDKIDRGSDTPQGITEAQEDRLVDACVGEGDFTRNRAACTAWVADLVVEAEAQGAGYPEVANYLADEIAERD